MATDGRYTRAQLERMNRSGRRTCAACGRRYEKGEACPRCEKVANSELRATEQAALDVLQDARGPVSWEAVARRSTLTAHTAGRALDSLADKGLAVMDDRGLWHLT